MREITENQKSRMLKNAKRIFILFFICLGLNISAQPAGSCSANFIYEVNNQTVTFMRTSQANQTGMLYFWSFGDGTSDSSSTSSTTHTYPQNGNYWATLTISNPSASCSAYFHDTVKIAGANEASCHAQFSSVSSQGGNTYFFNTSSGNVINSQWDFGDGTIMYDSLGGIYNSGGGDVSHIYNQSGTYNVCLTVSNDGDTSSYCSTVVYTSTCNSYFTASDSGLTASFSDMSTVSSNGVYHWDFGDGNVSTSHGSVTHTYLQSGIYNVCLTVSDSSNNCYDSYCFYDTIGNSVLGSCDATFTAWPLSQDPLSYVFYSDSSTSSTSYWDLGDGTTSPGSGILYHTYSQSGTYNVCKTITDSASNCSDHYCLTITIGNNPGSCDASFVVMQDSTDIYNYTVYSYSSNGSSYSYFWDFGDGASSTLQYPNHNYSGNGPYVLCLTVSDSSNNCSDSQCDTLLAGRSSGGIFLTVVSGATGVADNNSEIIEMSVFPNPASDILNVDYGRIINKGTLEIYDLTGQLIKKVEIDKASKHSLNVLDLSKGMYIMKVSDGKNSGVKRFIKQ